QLHLDEGQQALVRTGAQVLLERGDARAVLGVACLQAVVRAQARVGGRVDPHGGLELAPVGVGGRAVEGLVVHHDEDAVGAEVHIRLDAREARTARERDGLERVLARRGAAQVHAAVRDEAARGHERVTDGVRSSTDTRAPCSRSRACNSAMSSSRGRTPPRETAGGRRAADDPNVIAETADGLRSPRTAFGWIVAGLRERRRRGEQPYTVLCCDNIQGNGEVARRSIEAVARLVDPELADWIAAEVAFPSTMVDRITPVTTPADVARIHERLGVDDAWPVASEPFTQWVIDDRFPAGRPPLEQAGAMLVDDVEAYEAIKLRLLNAGHQALAYIGRLAGYELVDETVADERIVAWVRRYMEREAVPTLAVPEGFDIPAYIDELFERFGNAHVADTLTRLGTDASNRITAFVVPTLRDRIAAGFDAETGAQLIASWWAFTRRAAAGDFALHDEAAEQLMQAASGTP